MELRIDDEIMALIDRAIEEDLAGGVDVTSVATIEESSRSTANFVVKKDGVIAGLAVAKAVMERCGVASFQAKVSDGDLVTAGTVIATVEGVTRSILLAERSALNFISRLSGIATLTRAWIEAIKGSDTKIRDTRKTTPGLRSLEKYAVRVGGGINHRSTLSEAALLKDNHIAAAGSIKEAMASIRKRFPDVEIEVEVDSLEQLEEALQAEVPLILLDNMSPEMTEKAVLINRNRAKLESSGGIRLENAREYASTGVDFLAIGALTHSAPILDISLDLLSSGEGNR
ncbi:MAG: carboxylating nicotinate-nucleotide diphosphorylase [Candidatus Nanopelagicaceae bacterium]